MFSKVLEYTGEYKKTTYKAILTLVVAVVFYVGPFLFLSQIIAPLLGYGEISAAGLIWRVSAIAICQVLYAVLYVKGLELSHDSAYHTLKNLRISLQHKLEKQPLGTIEEKGVGAIKKIFTDDIENIELLLAHALPEGIANLAIPLFVFIGMFFVDIKLALLSLAALPFGILFMAVMLKAGLGSMSAYYGAAQKMNNTIVEYINGMEVVKVFNRDGESYHRFEADVKNYRDFTLKWYKVCWPWMALYNSILPCTTMLTLPLGSYFVLQGYSSLPDFILILCMSFGTGVPLLRSLSFMSTLPQIKYKIEALEKTMGDTALKQSSKNFIGKSHDIKFENVRFSYKEEEVLHGVSLEVKEGNLTALVGESGSGKSTLAKLLVHFYDISGGSIKIGGQDLTKMSIEALNNQISYVAQEQFLFNISLLENIRLGKLDATDEEVLTAAKKAQCGEFLERLEKGIYTMAGDGGKQLSGGERQRISLARAILKNAPIVVLDEATAFMDPENEEKMNEAIAEVISGKTVIVIAHRLHSIINADQICVLKNGNIVETGTHAELLRNESEYQKLWNAAQDSANWKVTTAKEGL
ncbi:ABC transporter ATP-binding protein [Anaerotignum sp. MB30-C6]|uniref:ABC transporter ATP-binding protein n=1 Tax=Anaerotignum sp. MB30-C6 TaxID=3070814 RepID=UPI0027DC87DF|nr:ABC transporter ATP-binding protein [Anaerotignum sp. MB30-C6]WMI79803.1 ABC transporter ATP-binding protein [Anaerotignum sp. MB30-C6]